MVPDNTSHAVIQGASLDGSGQSVSGSMLNVPRPTTLNFELGTLNSLVENDQRGLLLGCCFAVNNPG